MIRLLSENDRVEVLEYLYKDKNFNIFFIGDIENFGMKTDFQRVYGEYSDENELLSVFLRYRENAVYYADKPRFNQEYLNIFENDPFEYLSGKKDLMDLIRPFIKGYNEKHMYFCYCDSFNYKETDVSDVKVLSTKEEASKVFSLLETIKEFEYTKKDREGYVERKAENDKMGVTLFIERDGLVVSSVATTAETTKNAMVVAVATHKDYRNQGFASKLMMKLMDIYFNEKNKDLCLFYDNPDAGKIYHRLGFNTIGEWNMFSKK